MSRPVARKKLSWLTFWETTPVQDVLNADGTRVHRARTIVNEAEVEDLDDECTVLRVIGEFSWFAQNVTASIDRPIMYVNGMIVRESLDQTTTINLDSATSIEEYPWSWIRSYFCLPDGVSSQSQSGCVDATTPATALEKIDVRVKRKLRSGDELQFLTTASLRSYPGFALPANAPISIYSALRVRVLVEA